MGNTNAAGKHVMKAGVAAGRLVGAAKRAKAGGAKKGSLSTKAAGAVKGAKR